MLAVFPSDRKWCHSGSSLENNDSYGSQPTDPRNWWACKWPDSRIMSTIHTSEVQVHSARGAADHYTLWVEQGPPTNWGRAAPAMALDLDPVLTVSAPSKELYPAEKCHVTPPNRGARDPDGADMERTELQGTWYWHWLAKPWGGFPITGKTLQAMPLRLLTATSFSLGKNPKRCIVST